VIVRSICVANWRCLLDEVEVSPLNEGLTVIHAPNGSGKSTLFEALRRALLDGHRVTGRDIDAIRPWGRTLAPRVTVEFVHSGQEYRISKQFLDSPSALLERREDGRWRRLAEGTAADEKTREVLTKNPPGRGLARPENWGFAQVLWAPQGNLAIPVLSGDLVSDIRSMLSMQFSGPDAGPVENRIEERFLEFFTPKGKLKTGKDAPPLVRLKEKLAEALKEGRKAQELVFAFEEAARRVEELQARRVQARHTADEIMRALRQARAAAEAYRRLLAERERQSAGVKATEAQYKSLRQRLELIRSTAHELHEAENAFQTLKNEVPLKGREVENREREAARLKASLEDARKGRETVEAAARVAEAARRFNDGKREVSRLDEVIAKFKEAEQALTEQRQKRSALVAPDAGTLRAVRQAIKDRDEAQLRLDASLITLEIVPEEDGAVEVLAGEKPGPMALRAGVPTRIQGSPEVVADLTRVARVRAWGPVGSAEEHREARAGAERRLRELTEPFGATDLEALESLSQRAAELDAAIAEVEARLQALLAGRTPEELLQERHVVQATLGSLIEGYPDWERSAPDAEALQVKAEETKRDFISAVEGAEAAWEKAQGALTAVCGQKETLARRLEDTGRQAASLRARFAELTTDEKTLDERQAELDRLTMAWEAARTRLAEIEGQMAEYEDDPVAAMEVLEAQLEAANQESSKAREQEVREEARLEGLSALGAYSALAVAEETVGQIEQEVKKEELRAEAIWLLHETFSACRAEALAAVAGPVEAVATRTLQRISGRRLGRIEFGEGFEPARIAPEWMEKAVSLDNLSGGEQEQLYLATRLALAEVLGKDERQLVVLDDVLTATDAGRLARVMTVLEEAAERLQVLVLTCHPERYRGLRKARFLDFESLLQERLPG
jgi:DNA repair exonuclease SbcCD ATPase subunit